MLSFRKKRKIIIQPYHGYSSPHRLYMTGRILEDEGIYSEKNETLFQTLRNNFKRWESDEVPRAPVTLEIDNGIYQTLTDREGYFLIDERNGLELMESEQWLQVRLRAEFVHRRHQYHLQKPAEIFLPSGQATYGIISDIDDTILHTNVVSRLRMLGNTLLLNPYRRQALPGMSAWINALRNGHRSKSPNPVFYVSKSPRNIFDYLSIFLKVNQFPKGPILLRDFGRTGIRPADYTGHKEDEIDRIFRTYPNLSFILLGDIAGRDAEIYHHFQQKYPRQVLAIYLRDIKKKNRSEIFHSWKKDLRTPNLLLFDDISEGVIHSAEQGWISPDVVDQVKSLL